MKEQSYFGFFNLRTAEEVIEEFHRTLLYTNRDFKFFVNWEKVKQNVKKYKVSLNILNSLIKNQNFDSQLEYILKKYPEVLPCFPLLLAVRETEMKLVDDFMADNPHFMEYDFSEHKMTQEEIQKTIAFCDKAGLKTFFQNLCQVSLEDYLSGVEVGLDTNARKNRSGRVMEELIENLMVEIQSQVKIKAVLKQKNFKVLADYGFEVSNSIKERKADFIIIKENGAIINIEVNFFSDTGSKPQEIVGAYIDRQRELRRGGYYFIWVTDGSGWNGQRNQMIRAFDELDYVLNTSFVKRGFLQKIIEEI
ncbi:MAG TPA: type II restriction endonuclease [Candidatus Saccharicenans sp.]|jgi:type II restriction enzyme|nr:type II restriction endonuclease [Candidatus Saccharicenans sp.]HPP23478.1 type II restriction endonuclease [Candidatus Saccharicenans sp.]HQK28387.1 type II restriction endonuclease [Smithellaceae bacterium]